MEPDINIVIYNSSYDGTPIAIGVNWTDSKIHSIEEALKVGLKKISVENTELALKLFQHPVELDKFLKESN